MTLRLDEIEPGVVAYLDTAVLLADSRLKRRQSDHFRSGPFLCVAIGPGTSTWLKLTTKPGTRGLRPQVQAAWRTGGTVHWRTEPNYLGDELFVARDVVFADASHIETPAWSGERRARVSAEGIAAIMETMHLEIA